ncbi:MAG: transglutaminase domain-containing protein [Wujia sp.]
MAKVEQPKENIQLCEGVSLSGSFFEQKENRLFTIFIKGIVVYLIAMGSIGFYLSAFEISYNVFFCNIIIFVMAIVCALLYYRLLVENLGYLLLLGLFGLTVYILKTFINSGFYAIVNITVDEAATFFNQDIQKLYTEQIENRYLTVTFVVLFIGIVLDVLLNVYISRRMQYFTAIFIVMGLNMIPLYLTKEPDNIYIIMFLIGISMAYVYKSGKHYQPQVSNRRDDYIFSSKVKKNSKTIISYKANYRVMLQAGAIVSILIIAAVNIITAFKPKDEFNIGYEGNKYKDLTMAAVSTFLIDGWSGFFERSVDVGGLNGGKLGDVSSIKLDHATDLTVRLTPYNYDTIYLKSFTGVQYRPYDNQWLPLYSEAGYDYEQTPEADALSQAYYDEKRYSAQGLMIIRNVAAYPSAEYLPYYTKNFSLLNADEICAEYYPRMTNNETIVSPEYYRNGITYMEDEMYVPEENIGAIQELVEDAQLYGTQDEIVNKLKEYFQENIPYTVKPGKTPKHEDFVNYFLTENRKGYCAHYASAATLTFRYLGIPARYVEGYAVDYNQIIDGQLVEDEKYDDYFKGYSVLGETALVEVNVTDADAHAWVEIYDEKKGWYVVDVTPYGEVEEVMDFWEMFDDMVDSDGDNSTGGAAAAAIANFHVSDKLIRRICYVIIGIIATMLALICIIKLRRMLIVAIKYSKADINDRLVIKYSSMRRKKIKRDSKLAELHNYREQIRYLFTKKYEGMVPEYDYNEECQAIIGIMEQAGFSNEPVTESDYNRVAEWIRKI